MEEGMAQRIKKLRQEKGLTLEQVADVVGVGKSTGEWRVNQACQGAVAYLDTPSYQRISSCGRAGGCDGCSLLLG